MQLMIVGPPGAGKGTQSVLLCREFDLGYLSTGEMLREAVRSGSELGQRADKIMRAGDLFPDTLMLQLVGEWLTADRHEGGFLLDGFPRTVAQADGLKKQYGIQLDAVIHLHLDDEKIVSRLSGRRVHPASGRIYHLDNQPPKRPGLDDESGEELVQREDDLPAVVRRRLENYRLQTEPLLRFYREQGVPFFTVRGEDQVAEVFQRILEGASLRSMANKLRTRSP